MSQEKLKECTICNECWFNIGLRHSVCRTCTAYDKNNNNNKLSLMSTANDMDPGDMLDELPALTLVEEMLIAKVHVQI
jgi:hypothetical protein